MEAFYFLYSPFPLFTDVEMAFSKLGCRICIPRSCSEGGGGRRRPLKGVWKEDSHSPGFRWHHVFDTALGEGKRQMKADKSQVFPDHLEWQVTVEPAPEEQEASILLNLRPGQDLRPFAAIGVQRAGVVVTRPEIVGWTPKLR